jgi:hypothetical protein
VVFTLNNARTGDEKQPARTHVHWTNFERLTHTGILRQKPHHPLWVLFG